MENYIGNANWMYQYTKYIAHYFPEINISANLHDECYAILFSFIEEYNLSVFNIFFLKFTFDFVFLIFGLIRLILYSFHDVFKKKLGGLFFPFYWIWRCIGIVLLIQLYLILFITTFIPLLWLKRCKQ